MLFILLLILLLLAIGGGFALSKLIWIIALVLLIALIWNLFASRGPRDPMF